MNGPAVTGTGVAGGRTWGALRARRATLTTRGRCLLAGGVATAVCAVPIAERDLVRVGAFVAILPLLALLLVAVGSGNVRVRRSLTRDRLPVGAEATVTLQVSGGAAVGPLELADTVPDGAGALHAPRAATGRSAAPVRYRLRPVLRGAHRVGPVTARGVDPLGLAEFVRTVPGTQRLLVLPRVVALRGLPAASGLDVAHGAGAVGPGQGRSDVLVRPYRSGDELRRVHWRSTARHDELMVRLDERSWREGVTVVVDRRAEAHRGHGADASLEWAVSLAASVCVHLVERGEPVTLLTDDGTAPAGPGTAGRPDRVLDALATLRPSARAGFDGPPLPRAGTVVAILGALTPDALAALVARCPAGGHAVLLDVATWGGGPAPPVADPAAALERAGWSTVRATRGAAPDRVWDALVAGTGVP
jgi:uncharacterized protein (DUF58 family)